MRGKLAFARTQASQDGITPADAGKTLQKAVALNAGAGSPPQVRGKPDAGMNPLYDARITPAGAGKTPNLP